MQSLLQCVQELLKSPLINADLTDNYGLTAAEWAEQAQEKKCAKLLRECMKKTAATLVSYPLLIGSPAGAHLHASIRQIPRNRQKAIDSLRTKLFSS